MEKLGFLALIVALSAYIASVRLAMLGRLTNQTPAADRLKVKRFLVTLILADAPLVIAGLLLVTDLFGDEIFRADATRDLFYWAKTLFAFAIVVLAVHHLVSWCISIERYWTHRP